MNVIVKINGDVLYTSRLVLRPFNEDDLNSFFELCSFKAHIDFCGWKRHKSIEESNFVLNNIINEDKDFAICFDNKLIGCLGIEDYPYEDELVEIKHLKGKSLSFYLDESFWGKGLMVEAVNCVINYLFEVKDLDFVLCAYYDFNKQSKRVQEKCGFKFYKQMLLDTEFDKKEEGHINLLVNPKKDINI